MARMPRLAVAGQPHLVVQRGGDQLAFPDDADRALCLEALCAVARSGELAVHAYCLLDDGLLLLASPRNAADLGRFMQRVSRRYVPAYHRRHGGSGSLWVGRFQAAALEPEHYLLPAMLLIEQAPVRAGMVAMAPEWPWSSAQHHVGRHASPLVTEHEAWWRIGNTPFEREARHEIELQQMLSDARVAELLNAARGGWPLGSAAFMAMVAQVSGQAVMPRPRGRPRKPNDEVLI